MDLSKISGIILHAGIPEPPQVIDTAQVAITASSPETQDALENLIKLVYTAKVPIKDRTAPVDIPAFVRSYHLPLLLKSHTD